MWGGECFNIDFPIGVGRQNYSNWEMVLNSVKRFVNEESVFFCHSISCIFLVKWCIKNDIKIGKAIFVSGFNQYLGLDEDYDDVNCSMYTNRCKEFEKLCEERICYFSKSDPYVKYGKLQEFACLVNAKKIEDDNAGHFNKDAVYTKFTELLKYVEV